MKKIFFGILGMSLTVSVLLAEDVSVIHHSSCGVIRQIVDGSGVTSTTDWDEHSDEKTIFVNNNYFPVTQLYDEKISGFLVFKKWKSKATDGSWSCYISITGGDKDYQAKKEGMKSPDDVPTEFPKLIKDIPNCEKTEK